MKRRILTLAMAMLLSFNTPVFAAMTVEKSSSKAYLSNLNTYGIIQNVPADTDLDGELQKSGVLYAQLVELDGKAPKELVVVRKEYRAENASSHYFCEIWSYTKNKLVRISEGEYGFNGTMGSASLSIITSNGKNYLFAQGGFDRSGTEGDSEYVLKELKNGKLVAREIYRDSYETDGEGNLSREEYFVKTGEGVETPMNADAYKAKLSAFHKEERVIFRSNCNGPQVAQTWKVTADTLKELKRLSK